jgi:hypothetical protein
VQFLCGSHHARDGADFRLAPAIPDLSGVWQHPAFPWYEPPASGAPPFVTNLSRWAQQLPGGLAGSAAQPAGKVGISDYDQLVGDYKNPILQPWARRWLETRRNVCCRYHLRQSVQPVLAVSAAVHVQAVHGAVRTAPDRVLMLYSGDHEVRRVRMNAKHPSPLKPSWYGDSVGHYEGDTLVIDTVGVKVDRPYAMQDLFGTPYTDKLHIVERYRVRDYEEVKDALERNKKETGCSTAMSGQRAASSCKRKSRSKTRAYSPSRFPRP